MSRNPSQTLAILLEQHGVIRRLIASCECLLDDLDDDRPVEAELARAVARLRMTLEAHNAFEEGALRTVLLETDAFGPVRLDTMIDEHLEEHRAIHEGLAVLRSFPGGLRAVLASLRDHLDHEERFFLSPRVLRDDVVSVESSS